MICSSLSTVVSTVTFDNNYKHLPEFHPGKLTEGKNFGHIQHLPGSKMIDDQDKLLSAEACVKFIECKRKPTDNVIITEKIDGMNAGVVKKNGVLYPINRKGYDVRSMKNGLEELGQTWAKWVDEHYNVLDLILEEGERLVFENAIMTHTLRYKFTGDPVFLLAKYTVDNKKVSHAELMDIASKYNLRMPPVLCKGIAVDPRIVIKQYPKGLVGSKDGIEGVVYNYEVNGVHESCAKFVSNQLIQPMRENPPKYYNKVK